MKLVLIEGTWGGKWAQQGSPFRQVLDRAGVEVCEPPFEWSGDVSGIPSFFTGGKHSDWRAGGFALGLFLARIPFADRVVLAHSYGANVVAYSLLAVTGVPIRRLVTVGAPTRDDMEPVWVAAKTRIGFWAHICDPQPPMIERLAQLFDGRWDWCPKAGQQHADVNVKIPKMKHTKILDDAAMVEKWLTEEGLLDYVRAPTLDGERDARTAVQ